MNKTKRIAVITIAEHPCAQYLCANLSADDVDILLLSQNEPKFKYLSWGYLLRLLRQRGVKVFLDNWLITLIKLTTFQRLLKYFGRFRKSNTAYKKAPFKFKIWHDESWRDNLKSVKVVQVPAVNSSESILLLEKFAPDIILLGGAPIISQKIISISRLGVINPHYGITPRYAGNSPFIWALFDNRPNEIGYTIHYVVPQVDSGTIIEQKKVPWRPDWSWDTLDKYLLQVMYDRLVVIAKKVIAGEHINTKDQQVLSTNPPAGYITRAIAERHKSRLFYSGTKLVNQVMMDEDEIGEYITENFGNMLNNSDT